MSPMSTNKSTIEQNACFVKGIDTASVLQGLGLPLHPIPLLGFRWDASE